MTDALQAFGQADFHYVRPLDSVWRDSPFDVDDLNRQVLDTIVAEFLRQTRGLTDKAPGEIVIGPAGIGKTHLIGRLRQRVWEKGGWFVLLDIVGLRDFWTSAALSYANALQQPMESGDTQGEAIVAAIARSLNVERQVRDALSEPAIDPAKLTDVLLRGLFRAHRAQVQQHADVFRALILFCSQDFAASNIAYAWLQGMPCDQNACLGLGFQSFQRTPAELVAGLSWIMGLTGPTLVAVDQIDALVNPSVFAAADDGDGLGAEPTLAEVLAGGLMELHDKRHRGMTVMTCLEASWHTLERRALPSFRDRFTSRPKLLLGLENARAVERLIENRLAPAYAQAGFVPRHATWPFTPRAIDDAVGLLPRAILMRCEDHRRACLDAGDVTLCDTFRDRSLSPPDASPAATASDPWNDILARARAQVSIDGLPDPDDDAVMGALLRETLDLYVRQLPLSDANDAENLSDAAQKKPPLHGRLTFTFHDAEDRQRHYCFRAIEHARGTAFTPRLNAAVTAAGIGRTIAGRILVIVRRAPVPRGPVSTSVHDRFLKAGGLVIDPDDDDLRTFVALRAMRESTAYEGRQAELDAWLRAEKPLCKTAFFRTAGLCPPPLSPDGATSAPDEAASTPDVTPPGPTDDRKPEPPSGGGSVIPETPPRPGPSAAIPVGYRMAGAEPVGIPVGLLARHTAIIAGSGSGKTVLLRRIVEEAALAGIPAIVIDSNNDLSRLGDPWPERPTAFTAEDDAKARRYRETVDVVLWTPGVQAGHPLTLAVMPDFAALGNDPDERQQAVSMAEETLGPLAGARSNLQKGVLADALRRFAAEGGGDIRALIALLADLPDGVSAIGRAAQIGGKMADELLATMATNPLLGASAASADPATLFFGPRGRTRVSVINLSGLASDTARQDFVNRMQMTLFGWIKKHPSPTGLLYVVDEAQSFFPSGHAALSRLSGVQLVTQARKYGLGMVVATQAPRGIDNKIVSNCTTQFFGRQNAPATIQGAQEIIAASGGRADDIGKLKAGEFYFATEGSGRPGKIRTPICLSHHPANPPTPDEVIQRARRSAQALAGEG